MTEDILMKKHELEQRKLALQGLKYPVIRKQDLFSMKKRPRRLELKRYKKQVQRQIASYKEQVRKIDLYLEAVAAAKPNGNDLVQPKTSIHPFPRISKTKASLFARRFW